MRDKLTYAINCLHCFIKKKSEQEQRNKRKSGGRNKTIENLKCNSNVCNIYRLFIVCAREILL